MAHIFFAVVWGGGAASLFAIHCLYRPPPSAGFLARNLILVRVDDAILMPSALVCLVTAMQVHFATPWPQPWPPGTWP